MNRLKVIRRAFSNTNKILFEYHKNNCRVILNNEKVLNSIDLEMILRFKQEIQKWEEKNDYPSIVVLTTNPGSKAFSAGGDIKDIYNSKVSGNFKFEDLETFFKEEYHLDYLINLLKEKNVATVALWNGIVMGGGVGISINCSHKISCEKAVLAMPESRIGLFVDVGAIYHMNKLPRGLALAMILACNRLKGSDLVLSGLATDYVPYDNFRSLEADILQLESKQNFPDINHRLNNLIKNYSQPINEESFAKYQSMVTSFNQNFKGSSTEEIMKDTSQSKDPLVQKLYKSMLTNSPWSMKLNFQYLEYAKNLNLREIYKIDFRIIQHIFEENEFIIGVKNLLIDRSREKPKWTYESLEEVKPEIVDRMLQTDLEDHELKLDQKLFN